MQDEQVKKPNIRRRLKFIVPISVLFLASTAIAIFIKNMNGPAQGAVAYNISNQDSAKPSITSPHNYDGKYISFTYPTNYKIVPSTRSSGYLENISLTDTDHSGKYITVGILKETLANDSGVNYRKNHPDLYKPIYNINDKIIFTGTAESAEMTGFYSHGSYVATLSATANGKRDLTDDFNTISNSLEWKQ
jgi:hypothetical protein